MRLSGWYRIGVVAAFLWCFFIISFSVYFFYQTPCVNPCDYSYQKTLVETFLIKHEEIIDKHPRDLLDFSKLPDKPSRCVPEYKGIIIAMMLPIIVAWLLINSSIWAIRWIIKGFEK